MSQNTTVGAFNIGIKYDTDTLNQLEAQLKHIAEQVDRINGQRYYPGWDLAIKIKEESIKTGRVGSDTQDGFKEPVPIIKYWKIEIFIEGQDMAIVGYSKHELPVSEYDSDYLSIHQNASGIDTITIPLSRVVAIKSYAVTE
ncbi:hypothetical protein KKJ01_18730 [Xenorhabdus bovienii]|uniref:Uncharacterized protein n=1 Tax=Xenorhabdus bovienii TaxID=40576 RepID=A0AAJ1JCN9_XENBV|nr:hypothetical protein [Xenorhabdus bovienii]MDE1480196.1 hypothetical protein [Xenorhabdus bovienii]MDE9512214.1 hypothetical protein [Xenorhabdus bovienii]MDE9523668.1 hypothetical protein [Xenorhabdus bovienii]